MVSVHERKWREKTRVKNPFKVFCYTSAAGSACLKSGTLVLTEITSRHFIIFGEQDQDSTGLELQTIIQQCFHKMQRNPGLRHYASRHEIANWDTDTIVIRDRRLQESMQLWVSLVPLISETTL